MSVTYNGTLIDNIIINDTSISTPRTYYTQSELDSIGTALSNKGSTPASNSPSDIATAISNIKDATSVISNLRLNTYDIIGYYSYNGTSASSSNGLNFYFFLSISNNTITLSSNSNHNGSVYFNSDKGNIDFTVDENQVFCRVTKSATLDIAYHSGAIRYLTTSNFSCNGYQYIGYDYSSSSLTTSSSKIEFLRTDSRNRLCANVYMCVKFNS